jgi:dTDP-4-amino-4,6-dideoxygalactose transaminase
MELNFIRYNKFFLTGKELFFIEDSLKNEKISGDGKYNKLCQEIIEKNYHVKKSFLTPSCTSALEMAALLIDVNPGDEIIMPSFTFVSTANAFVLRGAKPIFADISPETLNITPEEIKSKISKKTKAVVVVHYGGVSCDMEKIIEICKLNNLYLIEDAAHAIHAKYQESFLGSLGDIATFSFHDTKNITCGEGGAILINNDKLIERAEIIREKGTNRNKFFRGEVDKYTWVDIGSSYLLSEVSAAFLYAQLLEVENITNKRLSIWDTYNRQFQKLQDVHHVKLPSIPEYSTHNAHNFYLILNSLEERDNLINYLRSFNIYSVFHYVPLHNSPAGIKYSFETNLPTTSKVSDTIIRLPLYPDLKIEDIHRIIKYTYEYFNIQH